MTPLENKPFENTVGKGEIVRNEQFLLFPQCFLPIWLTFCHSCQILSCRLQTFSLGESKICHLVMGEKSELCSKVLIPKIHLFSNICVNHTINKYIYSPYKPTKFTTCLYSKLLKTRKLHVIRYHYVICVVSMVMS